MIGLSTLVHRHLKASRYNYSTRLASGDLLLFNGATRAVAAFRGTDADVAAGLLQRCVASPPASRRATLIARYLAKNGFLLRCDADEIEALRVRCRTGSADAGDVHLILLPTLDCNARCCYCYEDRRATAMSRDVIERVSRWGELALPGRRALTLSWFGGEPLLELATVVELSGFFRDLCRALGLGFRNMMTTNGYLLTQEVAGELGDVGVSHFNITIDGCRDWHDRFRPHEKGGGTYDRAVEGACSVLSHIPEAHVTIRVNYTDESLDAAGGFLFDLPANARSRVSVYFREVFGQQGHRVSARVKTTREAMLYRAVVECGVAVDLESMLLGPKATHCYADRKAAMVVSPTGDVFKCALGKFSPRDRLGRIDGNGRVQWDRVAIEKWNAPDPFDDPECLLCVHLPLCMGGCRARRASGREKGGCTQPFEHIDMLLEQIFEREDSSA
jgi:uncharacterized protein